VRTLITAAILAAALGTASAGTALDTIRQTPNASIDQMEKEAVEMISKFCADRWGRDYDMQLFCRKKQTAAAKEFYDIARDIKSEYGAGTSADILDVAAETLNFCFIRWEGDFDMTMFCTKKQLEAWEKLNSRRK